MGPDPKKIASLSFAMVLLGTGAAMAENGYCGAMAYIKDDQNGRQYFVGWEINLFDLFGSHYNVSSQIEPGGVFAVAVVNEKEAKKNNGNCADAKPIAQECVNKLVEKLRVPASRLKGPSNFSETSWLDVIKGTDMIGVAGDKQLNYIQENRNKVYGFVVNTFPNLGRNWYLFDCSTL